MPIFTFLDFNLMCRNTKLKEKRKKIRILIANKPVVVLVVKNRVEEALVGAAERFSPSALSRRQDLQRISSSPRRRTLKKNDAQARGAQPMPLAAISSETRIALFEGFDLK